MPKSHILSLCFPLSFARDLLFIFSYIIMELEGFHRDPITGKYYRISENDPRYTFSSSIDHPAPKIDVIPKPKHIFDILHARQYGLRKNEEIVKPFLKMRLETLSFIEVERAIECNNLLNDLLYLKGGYENLFGMWNYSSSSKWLIIGEILSNSTSQRYFNTGITRASSGAIDITDGWKGSNCFMTVSNDLKTGVGKIQVHLHEFGRVSQSIRKNSNRSTVFSCCSNAAKQQFAIGGEESIDLDSVDRFLYSRKVKGNVRAVTFNNEGSIVFGGNHEGNVLIADLRDRGNINYRLFQNGVDETILLSNQHDLICGSFVGELCKFDTRMLRIVAKYHGHIHTPKKVPMSISETMNLLCGTGSDNVTRLWSLDGGEPVKTYDAPVQTPTTDPHRGWLVTSYRSTKLYLVQNNVKYSIELQDI